MQAIKATLVAGYTAERQCTERVSFSLFADVQPILTDPEDGEALRIDDVRSVNLSEGGHDRRSAAAVLHRDRARQPKPRASDRAGAGKPDEAGAGGRDRVRAQARRACRKSRCARMCSWPSRGSARRLGKIIGYSIALDGSDGRINCEVRIGCTIGRGGSAAATDGTPTYCTVDYAGADYQQFIERTVLFRVRRYLGRLCAADGRAE